MNQLNLKELETKLRNLAAKEISMDDLDGFNPYDQFGGNMDDAYFGGVDDGYVVLARELLAEFFDNGDIV